MANALNLLVGIAVLGALGFWATYLNRIIKEKIPVPAPSDKVSGKWSVLTGPEKGGSTLGEWERALFFVCFWLDAHLLVVAWLAFKVASKWQVWSSVVALPKELPDVDTIDYLISRRAWGAQTLTAFLVGTAFNIVAAAVAVAIARNWRLVWQAVNG